MNNIQGTAKKKERRRGHEKDCSSKKRRCLLSGQAKHPQPLQMSPLFPDLMSPSL
jgi:hypothetical protein